jgi:hypothetical protein
MIEPALFLLWMSVVAAAAVLTGIREDHRGGGR